MCISVVVFHAKPDGSRRAPGGKHRDFFDQKNKGMLSKSEIVAYHKAKNELKRCVNWTELCASTSHLICLAAPPCGFAPLRPAFNWLELSNTWLVRNKKTEALVTCFNIV